MRIVFAGTPHFAAAALAALIAAAPSRGWTIPLVLSQPDRPSGRGMKLAGSAVKQLALAHGIPVDTPASLRKGDAAAAARERLRLAAPDVLVVAAYGLILPQDVLDIPAGLRPDWSPRLTAINIHASLLPRWRGAAPIARAIEAGDATTGITIMQMDAGLDTGPMLLSAAVAIAPAAAGRCDVRLEDRQGRGVAGLDATERRPRPPSPRIRSVSGRVHAGERNPHQGVVRGDRGRRARHADRDRRGGRRRRSDDRMRTRRTLRDRTAAAGRQADERP